MTVYQYRQMHAGRIANGTCPVCGKRTSRSRRFTQTVNPYNRNADGSIKTPAEVQRDVEAEAAAWEPDFRHGACKG